MAMNFDTLDELLAELDAATSENILTVAAYFHVAFEAIHPFADGNGRVGRTLANYLLVSYGHPPIIIFDEDKMAYYGAMQVWDEEGDLAPMLDLLRDMAMLRVSYRPEGGETSNSVNNKIKLRNQDLSESL